MHSHAGAWERGIGIAIAIDFSIAIAIPRPIAVAYFRAVDFNLVPTLRVGMHTIFVPYNHHHLGRSYKILDIILNMV